MDADENAENTRPKRKHRSKFTVAEVCAAIKECKGGIFLAAKRLGCHYDTVSRYRNKHPEVDAVIRAERGQMVDAAELSLQRAILAGEPWACCFALKCLAKDRGYVERLEMTGAGGGPIEQSVLMIEVEKEDGNQHAHSNGTNGAARLTAGGAAYPPTGGGGSPNGIARH